uniref:Ribosomal protein S7 domain-containing protein n=1 Tax=Aegilops tauschii subsp. strangulata TaxID=200361 RepID=A0A453PQW0_AEGTS
MAKQNRKNIMLTRIIKHTMEIIHLLTDANPILPSLLP